jgi:hypothetical protein
MSTPTRIFPSHPSIASGSGGWFRRSTGPLPGPSHSWRSITGLTSAVGALDTVRTRWHLLTSARNGATQAATPHPPGPQRPTIALRHGPSAARGLAHSHVARSRNKRGGKGSPAVPSIVDSVAGLSTLLVLALAPGSRARRILTDLGTHIALIKKELACYITIHRPRRHRFAAANSAARPAFCGAGETPSGRWSTGPAWRSAAPAPGAPSRP